jgi:hypothetical protein
LSTAEIIGEAVLPESTFKPAAYQQDLSLANNAGSEPVQKVFVTDIATDMLTPTPGLSSADFDSKKSKAVSDDIAMSDFANSSVAPTTLIKLAPVVAAKRGPKPKGTKIVAQELSVPSAQTATTRSRKK